jgi:hypothetical protein
MFYLTIYRGRHIGIRHFTLRNGAPPSMRPSYREFLAAGLLLIKSPYPLYLDILHSQICFLLELFKRMHKPGSMSTRA